MQENASIYLDYAATTPIDKEILSKMMMVSSHYGNPSSVHTLGKNAKARLEQARKLVADMIGAYPNEIIFTSGATESNNTVLRSIRDDNQLPHIITTKLEHKSILETLEDEHNEIDYSFVETDANGIVNIKSLKSEIMETTKLISIHFVNNETGTIQPIKEISDFLKKENIPLHVDAAQALGHVDIDVHELDVEYMSFSGHKLGAPKGIGVLYVKEGANLHPLLTGGKQERNRRAGTENLMFAHAISIATKKAVRDLEDRIAHEKNMKELFISKLNEYDVPFELNTTAHVSTHILNLYLPFVNTDVILTRLDLEEIYISGGSACSAGTIQPSHVITELFDEERANHSIRISFSHMTTEDEILKTAQVFSKIYESLKGDE